MKSISILEMKPGDYVTRLGWKSSSIIRVTEVTGMVMHGTFNGALDTYTGPGWMLVERPSARPTEPIAQPEPTVTEAPAAATPKKKSPKGEQQYKGNGKHYWTKVTGETKRLRVPGGWLYNTGNASVFVPIPEVVGYAV